MTTKRKLVVTGAGSVMSLAASGVALVLVQISMVYSWGTQIQLAAFRPWTGKIPSAWDALVPLFGYAVSLFLFAAIILSLVFGWTLFNYRKHRGVPIPVR